jgi:hypothetical protein
MNQRRPKEAQHAPHILPWLHAQASPSAAAPVPAPAYTPAAASHASYPPTPTRASLPAPRLLAVPPPPPSPVPPASPAVVAAGSLPAALQLQANALAGVLVGTLASSTDPAGPLGPHSMLQKWVACVGWLEGGCGGLQAPWTPWTPWTACWLLGRPAGAVPMPRVLSLYSLTSYMYHTRVQVAVCAGVTPCWPCPAPPAQAAGGVAVPGAGA